MFTLLSIQKAQQAQYGGGGGQQRKKGGVREMMALLGHARVREQVIPAGADLDAPPETLGKAS